MKLFNNFEIVRFPEENVLFVTHNEYLYYIYNYKYKRWYKHKNAGNDWLAVRNYQEVTRDEILDVMDGIFPTRETDILRLCHPSELHIANMMSLLKEDYPQFFENKTINYAVHRFLREAHICYKAYLGVRSILKDAVMNSMDEGKVIDQIVRLSYEAVGRDIFKKEIEIIDGHDCSSYFWIQPVRVLDYTDTHEIDNVAEMKTAEISIEEDDVSLYLLPFLLNYYDDNLEANKKRVEDRWDDENGIEHIEYKEGFIWYLTHNFYTFDAVGNLLDDIRDTISALSSGRETDYTIELKKKRGFATYELVSARDMSPEQVAEYNANRPTEDDTPVELIIDFYVRFLYRMEYMMRVGKEKGFDLISFMGP